MAPLAGGQNPVWTTPPAAPATHASVSSQPVVSPFAPPDQVGFLTYWGQLAVGLRADPADPASLPPAHQEYWRAIVQGQRQKDTTAQLAAMTQLAQAYADAPRRLNLLSEHRVAKPYGVWLAEVRWSVLRGQCRLGRFDLTDVTALENPALIGILRQETQAAVDPLSSYMPRLGNPVPDPGNGGAGLSTVTVSNAIDLRPKAAYASAVLQAQLKLEPDMPGVDRVFLSRQLYAARRVFYRAMELEPQARALLVRQKELRRAQEEKARRDALRARSPSTGHGGSR